MVPDAGALIREARSRHGISQETLARRARTTQKQISREVVQDADGWTVRTRDGARSAHAEHTIVITRGQPLVLTAA